MLISDYIDNKIYEGVGVGSNSVSSIKGYEGGSNKKDSMFGSVSKAKESNDVKRITTLKTPIQNSGNKAIDKEIYKKIRENEFVSIKYPLWY